MTGFFSTAIVRDDDNEAIKARHRISGTLKFEGKGVVVVLYNQLQIFSEGVWVTQPSDLSIENTILQKLNERLLQ